MQINSIPIWVKIELKGASVEFAPNATIGRVNVSQERLVRVEAIQENVTARIGGNWHTRAIHVESNRQDYPACTRPWYDAAYVVEAKK